MMSSLLYSLGRAAFRRRRRVVGLWLIVLVIAGALAGVLGQGLSNNFVIPGTPSQQALDELAVRFPQVSGGQAQMVVVAPPGQQISRHREQIQATARQLAKADGVAATVDPFGKDPFGKPIRGAVSHDGRAALVTVQMDVSWDQVTDAQRATLVRIGDRLQRTGSEVEFGGQVFTASPPGISPTEGIGVVVALIVLLITFGSLRAAGMPLLTALFGVAVAMGLVLASSSITTISSTVPLLALMIGLAVGIDYALFVLSRHRDQLRSGLEPEESAARAIATAGSAVVFAGLTVIIALVGLAVARIPFLTTMGLASAGAVAIAVLVALTLLPAIFGFSGAKLRPKAPSAKKRPKKRPRRPVEPGRFARRWVRTVTAVPLLTVAVVVVGLGALALPARDLQLALPGNETAPAGSTQRLAYEEIREHFGPGFNAPLIVTADIINSTDPIGVVNGLRDQLEKLPGVTTTTTATPNAGADTGIVVVIPQAGPDAQATKDLVAEIRGKHAAFQRQYGADTQVTGQAALAIDVSDRLAGALLPFALLVVGLSLLLLGAVFRSIVVPLKAAVGYLLSVGAAFGLSVVVFQQGHLAGPLGVEHTGPIISFGPIVLMGVLFGLAMDYEVFLVSRMREEYVEHHEPRRAVEVGFVSGAKVVTAAALIMVSVFAAFVPEGDTNVKPIAFGLAVGVFIDAFVVRMILVPAVLALLGHAAWWLPGWLDRRLPHFDVEGEGLREELEYANWPAPGSPSVIDAEGLDVRDAAGQPVFQGVDLTVLPGTVLAVHGGSGTGKTALLLALAGRLPLDGGRLKVCGKPLPAQARAVRGRAGLAETAGLNDLEESLTVEQHVAERLAAQRLSLWVSRARVRAVLDGLDDAVHAAGAALPPIRRTQLVADLAPLERRVLGIALAMIGRPSLLVVDDADSLRDPADRLSLWRALAWLTTEFTDQEGRPLTVVASCTDPGEARSAVPADRLQLVALDPAPVAPTLEKVH
jgi:putative drug exporter of the RND superfamily